MSSSSPSPPSLPSSSGGGSSSYFTNLGLGYPIAVALAFLVLLSILLLASYICCRASARRRTRTQSLPTNDGVILPRIIFVAEDDDDDDNGNNNRDEEDMAVVGLEQMVINSYPKFPYDRSAGKEALCSICLCEYKEAEMLRMMPECRHYFHLCCLDAWLRLNGSCPVCRNSPLPTPLSTPLQEVVPLSQFSADRRRRT